MKASSTVSTKLANYLIALVLVLVPFHAFITVWTSVLVGHYTVVRLWDAALLLVLAGLAVTWLIRDGALWRWFSGSLLVRLIAGYAGLTILLAMIALLKGDVTAKALGYGLLVNLRFLLWFLCVLLAVRRSSWLQRYWRRLALIPAALVVVFAVLQYTVLPHNFLSHFGYNAATTIAPIETINHNPHYIRVQSTLRGANPLGAYLVIIIAAVSALWLQKWRRLALAVLGLAALFALYASGSRSAWLGVVVSMVCIAWMWLHTTRQRLIFGGALLTAAFVAVGAYFAFQHNARVQNAVLHTQNNATSSHTTSNEAHASAVWSGLQDVVAQPFGDGPGTAGPASVYNGDHPARIAENYYIQIAQETGWIGMVLLLTIFALVGAELYQRKQALLALALLAAFVGLALVNMLSHAWVDDTLSFVWWGLAAIALGRNPSGKTDAL